MEKDLSKSIDCCARKDKGGKKIIFDQLNMKKHFKNQID